jgi:radical SAM protein with 4Fe4S-binding SPASM domain
MNRTRVSSRSLAGLPLWDKASAKRIPLSVDLELTARCNNNCRHCYVNLPAGDVAAKAGEMDAGFILDVADQAVSLGTLWCLLTGGEPLLREDFPEIYLGLRKKGLLVSVFTNAALVGEGQAELFKTYPPRHVEVSVYGATEATYERVTRTPGSYRAFRKGLDRLLAAGLAVRFKTMALRSNAAELSAIAEFCRPRTRQIFRFDPLLHLRVDGDRARNEEIKAERLSPMDIVVLERSDPDRFEAMERNCDSLILPGRAAVGCRHLFYCGAGRSSFGVTWDGLFSLCLSLRRPDKLFDLRRGSLRAAWEEFAPRLLDLKSDRPEFLARCGGCPIVNLCLWCPAHAYLETGELDAPVEYFCEVAHARSRALQDVLGAKDKEGAS